MKLRGFSEALKCTSPLLALDGGRAPSQSLQTRTLKHPQPGFQGKKRKEEKGRGGGVGNNFFFFSTFLWSQEITKNIGSSLQN